MQIIRHIGEKGQDLAGSVVTLGNFDGIHLGHQALIAGAVADSKKLALPSVVLTFEPHPVSVLAPERAPKLILAHKDKMQLLQSFGVDIVAVQHFDLSFAKLSAEDFVRDLLVRRLKARKIWAGKDLRFGQGRKGDVEDLRRWGRELGFEVAVVEPVLVDGNRVSSSRIRELLSEGRVDEVKAMLGRYHFVSGRVVEGHRRGKDLGFPTANYLFAHRSAAQRRNLRHDLPSGRAFPAERQQHRVQSDIRRGTEDGGKFYHGVRRKYLWRDGALIVRQTNSR